MEHQHIYSEDEMSPHSLAVIPGRAGGGYCVTKGGTLVSLDISLPFTSPAQSILSKAIGRREAHIGGGGFSLHLELRQESFFSLPWIPLIPKSVFNSVPHS